jgi:antirestriction protein ArdC
MSTLTTRRASQKAKAESGNPLRPDSYQQVTDQIIEHLENGVVPWRCPWNRETGRPRNFTTGKPYRGVNSILLGCRHAASPWWMTYRQAMERGGHVRKGERGAMVVKYGTFTPKDAPQPTIDAATDGKQAKRGYLRGFIVFNASQIDGIEFPPPQQGPVLAADQRIALAEAIVQNMPQRPVIHEGRGTRAVYRPSLDEVDMPAFGSFESAEAFHLTLFHELAHATGHASRLNRPSLTKHDEFGGPVYSQEELVAEMTAAFIGMEAGLIRDRHEQSAAYLNSWLGVLSARNHRHWIVQAASQANLAADFILGRNAEDESPSETECLHQSQAAAGDNPEPTA